MNALADKVQKQDMPQWHALHNMATLFNNQPYTCVITGKFSADWHATATYVGMVVE